MSARTKKKEGFWNLTEELEGDKIIWMIVFMLIMFFFKKFYILRSI